MTITDHSEIIGIQNNKNLDFKWNYHLNTEELFWYSDYSEIRAFGI